MPADWEYLFSLILVLTVFFCLQWALCRKVRSFRFFKTFAQALPIYLLIGFCWDGCAIHREWWSFEKIIGVWFIVPLEEILFFVVIPFLVAVVYNGYVYYCNPKEFSIHSIHDDDNDQRPAVFSAGLADFNNVLRKSGPNSAAAPSPTEKVNPLPAIAPLVIGICGYSLFFWFFFKGPTLPWEYFGSEMVIVAGVIFYVAYNWIVCKRRAFVKAFLYLTPLYFFMGFVWDAIGIWRSWWIFPITMKEQWPAWVIPISHDTHIMPIEELIFFMVVPWLCICVFDAVQTRRDQ